MEYRKLPHGGEKISILGLGNSSMGAAGEKEIEATVALAVENGINYFDMAAGDAVPFLSLIHIWNISIITIIAISGQR